MELNKLLKVLTKSNHHIYNVSEKEWICADNVSDGLRNNMVRAPLSDPDSIRVIRGRRSGSSAEDAVEVPFIFERRLKWDPRGGQEPMKQHFRHHDCVVAASLPVDSDQRQNRADPTIYSRAAVGCHTVMWVISRCLWWVRMSERWADSTKIPQDHFLL